MVLSVSCYKKYTMLQWDFCQSKIEIIFDVIFCHFAVGKHNILFIYIAHFIFQKDQHSITFIDTNEIRLVDYFKCTNGNNFRPITSYLSFHDKRNLSERNTLSSFSTTNGILLNLRSEVFDVFTKIYPKISEYNPRTKLMIKSDNMELAKDYLVIGWEKFKILENAILVTEKNNISVCLYNPFFGDKKSRTPKFYCQDVFYNTIETVLDNVKDFVRERTKNLHEYPLKVSI